MNDREWAAQDPGKREYPERPAAAPQAPSGQQAEPTEAMFAHISAIDNTMDREDMRQIIEGILALAGQQSAAPAGTKLRWCHDCGEGITTFCRGKESAETCKMFPASATGAEPAGFLAYQGAVSVFYPSMSILSVETKRWNPPVSKIVPLYATPTTSTTGKVDVEQMLRDCVPGGSSCDPQAICDDIRNWFANGGKNV